MIELFKRSPALPALFLLWFFLPAPALEPGYGDLPAASVASEPPSTAALTPPADDEADFRELLRLARKRVLTELEELRCLELVERLGERRPMRRAVARLLNRDGGKLDRRINAIMNRRAWKKHGPLPNRADLDAAVMRGGQPSEEGFRRLREMGVATVVNLRMEDEGEKPVVESLGMRYVPILIPDTGPPTTAQAEQFLEECRRATSGSKLFFHCAAGSYRTGTMAALYRISKGMTVDDALEEAGRFGWREAWLNADLEAEFLRDWAASRTFGAPARPQELSIDAP